MVRWYQMPGLCVCWSLDGNTSCASLPWRFSLYGDPVVKLIHHSWYSEAYYITASVLVGMGLPAANSAQHQSFADSRLEKDWGRWDKVHFNYDVFCKGLWCRSLIRSAVTKDMTLRSFLCNCVNITSLIHSTWHFGRCVRCTCNISVTTDSAN